MIPVRRKIRRIEPLAQATFDDQLWPTNVALLMLATLTCGLIFVTGNFQDPRPLYNGWVQLLTLGATLVALVVAVNSLSQRRARRLQMAVLISLVLHVLLAVFLYQQHLRVAKDRRDDPSHPTLNRDQTMPLYVEVIETDAQQPFEQPVPTSVRAEMAEATDIERTEAPDTAPTQMAVSDPNSNVPVSATPRPQVQRAAPRRSETFSQLSRQTQEATVQSSLAQLPPDARRQVSQSVVQPEPAAVQLERVRDQRVTAQNAAAPREVTQAEAANNPTRTPPRHDNPQAAQLSAEFPRSTVPTEQVVDAAAEPVPDRRLAEESSSRPLEPTDRPLPRQRTENVATTREVATSPDLAVNTSENPRQRPELPAEPDVALAHALAPNRDRTPAEISADATPIAASRRPSERTTEPSQTALQSQPTSLARTSQQDPTSDPLWEPAESVGGMQVAGQPVDAPRGEANPEPSLQPIASSAEPRRAMQPADAIAAPATTQLAQAANSRSRQPSDVRPAQIALARAASGVSGGESGENLTDDLPSTPQQSAPQPSTAARRPVATGQQVGPALAPSSSVRIARAISEADAPALGAAAAPVETAEAAGAAEPARIVASSGATIERLNAATPVAPIVAAEGTSSADLGTEQRVPDLGRRRAGGGGEPEISLAASLPIRRDSDQGGAPHAALTGEAIAPLPSAPPTGGQTALARSETVDAAATSGGRAALASVSNPQVFAGSLVSAAAGEIAPSDLRRERTSLATPGLQPGGGLDSPRRRATEGAVAGATTSMVADAATRPPTTAPSPFGPAATSQMVRSEAEFGSGTPRGPQPNSQANTHLDTTEGVAAALPATQRNRPSQSVEPQHAESGESIAARSVRPAPLPTLEASASEIQLASSVSPAAGPPTTAPATLDPIAASPIGRTELAVAVDIQEPVDHGGLAIAPAESAGSPDRRAQPHSELVRVEPDRFLRRRAGGAAAIAGDVRAPAPAFARRARRQSDVEIPGAERPSAKTEAAIELGLVYLARHQRTDGRWSLAFNGVDLQRAPRERPQLQADTAATGLALLAFLGAGYDHYDEKYHEVVDRGLRFLTEIQKDDGDLYVAEDELSNQYNHLYSHGIATIALCEAYGMTGDPALREPAQRAIDFIVSAQHPEHGGWRYIPGAGGYSSDLSVTGWQIMALKSGQLAGLEVPNQAYDEARRFLATCLAGTAKQTLYVYNPLATSGTQSQQHGSRPSTVMTSVGLLMEFYLGHNRDDASMQSGAQQLLKNLPALGGTDTTPRIGTLDNPLRDTYYWYYATQVMFHMRGEYWKRWNETLHPLLINSQTQTGRLAGSWNPFQPVRDQWAPHAGRLYVTALNLLSLEVYYRHLPLYDETAR